MTDYRSPAATHSTYAKDDPTAVPVTTSGNVPGGVAYAGHPANSVTVSDSGFASNTTDPSAHHHHHHGGHHHSHPHSTSSTTTTNTAPSNQSQPAMGRTGEDAATTQRLVKTGEYVTGLEPAAAALGPNPVPVVGNSHQERIAGAPATAGPAPRVDAGPLHDTRGNAGLPAAAGQGGPLGGAVMLGGQCECMRNGGKCECGAGQCKCRGCSTGATVVNPGANVGIADTVNRDSETARQAGR